MRKTVRTIALSSLALVAAAPLAAAPVPAYIATAVADPGRPAADTSRDEGRLPGAMLAFAGVKPGMTVVDLLPGGGYFTRIFAKAVGPKGMVVAYYNSANDERAKAAGRDLSTQGQDLKAAYPNISVVRTPLPTMTLPMPADIIWTSDNYHDLHNPNANDIPALNKAIYAALKPGGYYVMIDHRALKGAGPSVTSTLHRMDEDIAKQEILAAGFKLVAEGKDLTRPSDDDGKRVFEAGEHDHTDQMMLKFQKPRR